MRNLNELNAYRRTSGDVVNVFGGVGDHETGVFDIPYPRSSVCLLVIASAGEGWDHISVSLPNRCPNWQEMEHVKRMFFRDNETAMQLHVPPSEHLSLAHTCLHLWRPHNVDIPRPPAELVGAG